jgi:uncharacterized protein
MTAADYDLQDPALTGKLEAMLARFGELGRVVVAFSGGVDSALALKVGALALGDDCIGVTARSESLPGEEFELAAALAREHGLRQEVIEYSELAIEGYAENPVNRCYFCKKELYTRLTDLARSLGARAIVDGANADDAGDYRPGAQAAEELRVVSPLREAGMTKADVRTMARALGLSNWDKPAGACLSSRVPYGERIDADKLDRIARGEALLRSLGFAQSRVRHHGEIARVEVEPKLIALLAEPERRARVVAGLREIGFRYVTLDLTGYRTGSLNESLPGQALASDL